MGQPSVGPSLYVESLYVWCMMYVCLSKFLIGRATSSQPMRGQHNDARLMPGWRQVYRMCLFVFLCFRFVSSPSRKKAVKQLRAENCKVKTNEIRLSSRASWQWDTLVSVMRTLTPTNQVRNEPIDENNRWNIFFKWNHFSSPVRLRGQIFCP